MRRLVTLTAAAWLSWNSGVAASVLYSGSSQLFQINQTTGATTNTGLSTSPTFVTDLASDLRSGHVSMWGITRNPVFSAQAALVQIDPVAKSVSPVKPLPTISIGSRDTVMAIDPATGRTFVGSAGPTSTQLFDVDRATGAARLIGSVGLSLQSLAFDEQGVLYGTTEESGLNCKVHVINTTTAAATLLHALPLYRILGLALRPEDHQMFALDYGPGSYRLHKIDLATGALTDVGPSLVRPANLTFYVAEPTSAALLTLAAASVCVVRRRWRG